MNNSTNSCKIVKSAKKERLLVWWKLVRSGKACRGYHDPAKSRRQQSNAFQDHPASQILKSGLPGAGTPDMSPGPFKSYDCIPTPQPPSPGGPKGSYVCLCNRTKTAFHQLPSKSVKSRKTILLRDWRPQRQRAPEKAKRRLAVSLLSGQIQSNLFLKCSAERKEELFLSMNTDLPTSQARNLFPLNLW